MSIGKKRVIIFLLVFITLLILDMFHLTPFGRIAEFLLLLLSTIGHVIFLKGYSQFNSKVRIWYIVFLVLMLISMAVSYLNYGIGLVSLFIANINLYHIGSACLFYYLFTYYKISINDYFTALEKTAWVFLLFYLLMLFTGFEFSHVSELTGRKVTIDLSKIPTSIATFLGLYWISKFIYNNRYLYLFIGLIFLSVVHWEEIQRFHFLVTILVLFTAVILAEKKSKRWAIKTATVKLVLMTLLILPILLFLVNNSFLVSNIERFGQASKIVSLDRENIEDPSTAVRVAEVLYAVDKFSVKPFLGHGLFRASDKEKIVGDTYFYVQDIGFIAFLFSFGMLGMLIFSSQIIVLLKYFKRGHIDNIQLSLLLYFLYSMAFSFLSGSSIYKAHFFLFLIILLVLSFMNKKLVLVELKN